MALKVMSFNIRYDNPDEAPQDKWDIRKSTCVEIISKYRPHLLGLQEPHKHQVEQLAEALPGYSWFGKGRYLTFFGINETHNEFNPIFFDSEALTLEASGTFWYSDTPEVPNTKWSESAFPRIATWGRFSVKATGQRLCFVNTHFDHEAEGARTRAAEVLIAQLPVVSQGLPSVVVGDLNCSFGSPALEKLSGALTECNTFCSDVLPGMLGRTSTFCGFDKSIDAQIDFIFTAQGALPTAYGTVPDECPNGRCCSDHRPVMASIELPPAPEPGSAEALAAEAAAAAAAAGAAPAPAAGAPQPSTTQAAAAKAAFAAEAAAAKTSALAGAAASKASEAASTAAGAASAAASKAADKATEYAAVAADEAAKAAAVAKEEAKKAAAAAVEQASKAFGKLKTLF